VFRAHDVEHDRLVAIKVFLSNLTISDATLLLRALEDLVSKVPAHQAIISPIAAGLDGRVGYLVMEHAVGESVDEIRSALPMGLVQVVRIIEPIAQALDLSAGRGVHHLQLHPRDVILASEGPRVTGVGVAEALTSAGLTLPSRPPYEPAEGPSDVYAVAAIAYELLSGRRMTRDGWDELSAEDGPELRDAFASALAADPAQRPPRAGDFAALLKHAADKMAASLGTTERVVPFDLLRDHEPVVDAQPTEPVAAEPAEVGEEEAITIAAYAPAPYEPEPVPLDSEHIDREPVVAPAHDEFDAPVHDEFDDVGIDRFAEAGAAADLRIETDDEDSSEDATEPINEIPESIAPVSVSRAWAPPGLLESGSRASRPRRISPAFFLTAIVAALITAAGAYTLRHRNVGPKSPADTANATASTTVDLPPAPVPAPGPTATTPAAPTAGSGRAAGVSAAAPRSADQGDVRRGRLLVRSTPAGATVAINGDVRGKTPLVVRDLPFGSYTIHLARDGFAGLDRRVRLTPTQPSASLALLLRRTAAPPPQQPPQGGSGSMVVESHPSGARVFVNGRMIGETPLTVPGLPSGFATVRLEKDGYRTWTSSVRVNATRAHVAASLERLERK
jgi:PEGA domain